MNNDWLQRCLKNITSERVIHEVSGSIVAYRVDEFSLEEALKKVDLLYSIPQGVMKRAVIVGLLKNCMYEDVRRERRLYSVQPCYICKTRGIQRNMHWVDDSLLCQSCTEKLYSYPCVNCGRSFSLDTSKQNRELCKDCRRKYPKELNRVSHANTRSRKENLKSSLSLKDWFYTLRFFDFSCAYCGGGFECIEHYKPISQGGGSYLTNCLPACYKCNALKNDVDPSSKIAVLELFELEKIQRILLFIEMHKQ